MARIVIHEALGQLGNCLYRLANLIVFARENGFVVYDLSFSNSGYASGFEKTYRQPLIRYPAAVELPCSAYLVQKHVRKMYRYMIRYGWVRMKEVSDDGQQFNLDSLKGVELDSKTIALHGVHFQADELVRKHADYIRNYLAPRRRIKRKITKLHREMRQNAELVVGVHIRLGDFKEWMGGRFYFQVDTYVKSMKDLADHFGMKRIKFIVFGNGNEVVENHDYSGLDVAFARGRPTEDIYHLSLCDLLIGTMYSTFSGWASFYGEVPILRIYERDQSFRMEDFNVVEVLNNTFTHNKIH